MSRRRLGLAVGAVALAVVAAQVLPPIDVHDELEGPRRAHGQAGTSATVPASTLLGRVALQGRQDHSGAVLLLDGTPRATSDPTGHVHIDGVAPGPHRLAAQAEGFLCNAAAVDVLPQGTTRARGMFLTGGDAIADDEIDLFDLVAVAASYGRTTGMDPRADLNLDGKVNLFDLVMVTSSYGRSCPFDQPALAPPVGTIAGTPTLGATPTPATATVTHTPTLTATATAPTVTATPTPGAPATAATHATARPDGAAVVLAQEAVVRIVDGAFRPHALYAAPGAWITWRNDDSVAHELWVPAAGVATRLEPGEHFNLQLDDAGIVPFHCGLHDGMSGVLIVPQDLQAPADYFDGGSIRDYYARGCSSCHGRAREGAIGPALVPGRLSDDDESYVSIIRDGRPGSSMPAWGRGGLSDEEIWGMVGFLRSDAAPEALSWTADQIRGSLRVLADESALPTAPTHRANLDALMLVTERESRSIAVLDGERHELVGRIGASYRAHGYAFDPTNDRWVYNVGRDGWVSRIDLYTLRATRQVRVGLDSRGIAISDDGGTLVVGNYIPTTAVVLDATTLEPIKVIATEGVDPDGRFVRSRVAITSDVAPDLAGPYFLLGLKEAGQVWRINWADPELPIDKLAGVGRILHDGFLDPSNERFFVAAQADDRIVAIDVVGWSIAGHVATGQVPHPGSGAVWHTDDRDFAATVHAGEGQVTVWDLADLSIVGRIPTAGPGLFLRAASNSPYVWADAMFAPEPHQITVFRKEPPFGVVGRITDGQQTLHPELTADGRFTYVSDWQGDVVRVYDARTLERVATIEGIRDPTGIFAAARRFERLGH